MVNCTSEEEIHDGMYWKVGDTDYPVEYVNSVSQSVPLLDWNVTAECKIKLNNTNECSKELEITLFSKFNSTCVIYNGKNFPEKTIIYLKC